MANAKGDHVDTTYLTVTQTTKRGYFHRDYQAHCVKYSHLIKFIREQRYWEEPWILDVGCGRETPLAQPLAARQNVRAEHVGYYVGLDYGPIDRKWLSEKSDFPAVFYPEVDFAELDWPLDEWGGSFQIINCQEVLEHVEPEHAFRMLKKIHDYMAADGRAFISTPIYNGKAAANHVNEMSFFGFETMMELAGFEVEHVQGTFASQADYKHTLKDEALWTYNVLKNWFEAEVLSMVMGPLIKPELARNAMWRMTKSTPVTLDVATWEYFEKPEHGSSDQWKSFVQNLRFAGHVKQLKGG